MSLKENLICRYAKDGSGFDIGGTSSALKIFVECLSKTSTPYYFFVPKESAKPYECFLDKFIFEERGGEKLKIYLREKSLVCSGDKRHLKILLENILNFSQQEFSEDMHIHEEYFEDHYYLDAEAEAIVFSRKS